MEKLREIGNVNLIAIILFGIVLMILFVLLFVHRVSLEVSETILSAQSPELVAEKLADQRCTKGRITPHTGTLNLGSTAAIVFSLVSIYIETVRQCF